MPRWARAAALLAALLVMAGCGSGDDSTEEPALDYGVDYRANPPAYEVNVASVTQTAIGTDPYRVRVLVWNLGTERDIYELSAVRRGDPETSGDRLHGFATVDPPTVRLEGRSFVIVDLTLTEPRPEGLTTVGFELATSHLALGEGLDIEITGVRDGLVPPELAEVTATTGRDQPVTVDVVQRAEAGERRDGSRPALDPSSVGVRNIMPATGHFEVTDDHRLLFDPDPEFSGTVVAFYELCDVEGACGASTITISVEA